MVKGIYFNRIIIRVATQNQVAILLWHRNWTFDWPSKSHDLNIIENEWKMISDIIYEEQLLYNNLDELCLWMDDAFDDDVEINRNTIEFIENLYESNPKQLIDVVASNGSIT